MSVATRADSAAAAADCELPVRARRFALTVLCASILMINLDNTVLNVALPTLVRDLHATSSQLQWIVDAYALVFGGLLLVAGSLADRVGRKKTFLAGLAAFAAGSAWAAFSGSVALLIAARASMGIGAALMMPSTLSIITDVFRDPGQRQRAIGVWAGTSGVGFALGPIVGGFLLAHFWWGSVFLINVPIALVGLACAVAFVPDSANPRALAPDGVGAALSITGLGLVLYAIIEAPAHGWSAAQVVAAGTAGLAVLVIFVGWERASSHPMLNLGFFRARAFSGAVSSVSLLMFGLVGGLFLFTQIMQFDLGYSPLQAGVRTLPVAAALAVVSPLSALLVRVLGTRLTMVAGLALIAAGLYQNAQATVSWTFGDFVIGLVLIGIGSALVLPAASGSVLGSLPKGDTGVGSATNGVAIQVGGALGVAAIGSVQASRYQDRLDGALAGHPIPHPVRETVMGSIGGALQTAQHVGGAAGAQLAHAARVAFISGSDLGLTLAALLAVAGCLLAFVVLPRRTSAAASLQSDVDTAAPLDERATRTSAHDHRRRCAVGLTRRARKDGTP